MMPPQDPAATLVNIQLSRTELYGILGGVVGLVSLGYWGIKADITDIRKDVRDLAGSYREAVTSGVKVQDLITKSPTLEKTINETHDAVIKVQGGVDLLNQKVDANQQQTKIQLDNIQKQVHERK
jgi:hypothetical protein